MEKVFTHKNYKTFEEASKVWETKVKELFSDYLVFYDEPVEEKEQLIGIEVEEKHEIDIKKKILAVGVKTEKLTSGDYVLLDPRMYMTQSQPTIIDDCLFWLTPSRAAIATLN
jgi:hypothetical protein